MFLEYRVSNKLHKFIDGGEILIIKKKKRCLKIHSNDIYKYRIVDGRHINLDSLR